MAKVFSRIAAAVFLPLPVVALADSTEAATTPIPGTTPIPAATTPIPSAETVTNVEAEKPQDVKVLEVGGAGEAGGEACESVEFKPAHEDKEHDEMAHHDEGLFGDWGDLFFGEDSQEESEDPEEYENFGYGAGDPHDYANSTQGNYYHPNQLGGLINGLGNVFQQMPRGTGHQGGNPLAALENLFGEVQEAHANGESHPVTELLGNLFGGAQQHQAPAQPQPPRMMVRRGADGRDYMMPAPQPMLMGYDANGRPVYGMPQQQPRLAPQPVAPVNNNLTSFLNGAPAQNVQLKNGEKIQWLDADAAKKALEKLGPVDVEAVKEKVANGEDKVVVLDKEEVAKNVAANNAVVSGDVLEEASTAGSEGDSVAGSDSSASTGVQQRFMRRPAPAAQQQQKLAVDPAVTEALKKAAEAQQQHYMEPGYGHSMENWNQQTVPVC